MSASSPGLRLLVLEGVQPTGLNTAKQLQLLVLRDYVVLPEPASNLKHTYPTLVPPEKLEGAIGVREAFKREPGTADGRCTNDRSRTRGIEEGRR